MPLTTEEAVIVSVVRLTQDRLAKGEATGQSLWRKIKSRTHCVSYSLEVAGTSGPPHILTVKGKKA